MRHSAAVFLGAALLAGHPHATAPGASPIASLQPAPPAATWSDVAPLPSGRKYFAAAVTADGQVLATGGTNTTGSVLATVEAYDPSANTWTTMASLPQPRAGHASVTANGVTYVIGGLVGTGFTPSVLAYAPSTNTWSSVADMGVSALGFGAAVLGGKIYVAGGYGAKTGSFQIAALAAAETYDPGTNQWTAIASLIHARVFNALAAGSDGRIYAIGGSYNSGSRLASVEAYDPATNQWTDVASLPSGRSDLAAVTGGDGLIYVIGGMTSAGPQDTVLVYDVKTDTWSVAPSQNQARTDLAAAASPGGQLYALGGTDYLASGDLSSVESYGTAPKAAPPIAVTIQVKSGANGPINRSSRGTVPVAVFSSSTFDATKIDRTTVVFAGAPALAIGEASADLNGDGLPDVMLHFSTQALVLPDGTTQACMTGKTTDQKSFQGCDSIRLVK